MCGVLHTSTRTIHELCGTPHLRLPPISQQRVGVFSTAGEHASAAAKDEAIARSANTTAWPVQLNASKCMLCCSFILEAPQPISQPRSALRAALRHPHPVTILQTGIFSDSVQLGSLGQEVR